MICKICGSELDPDKIDICDNCKASIIINDDILPINKNVKYILDYSRDWCHK